MQDLAIDWGENLHRGIWPRSGIVWIMALWTALLIIRPWEKMFPWMQPLRTELVYTLFALTVLLSSGQMRIVSSIQTTGLLLWFGALASSALLGIDIATSWNVLYVHITTFIFFFALLAGIRTPYQLMWIVTCFVLSTALFLAKSQSEYHLFGAGNFTMGVRRLTGDNMTYEHANSVTTLAVMSLPFALFLWNVRRAFTRTWPTTWRSAFIGGVALFFPLVVTSIILTNSRTGMLSFVAFVAIVALSGQRWSRIAAGAFGGVALAGAIWIFMPADSRHRFETMWAPPESRVDESAQASAEGRKLGVQVALEIFRRFPVTGVGLGNFLPYRMEYLDRIRLVAHNTYAAVLSETGALGMAAFLFFILGVFINARRANRLARLVPDPLIQLLAQLTIACRRSMLLLLFAGMAHDFQALAPFFWIPAYCQMACSFASTIAQNAEMLQVEAGAWGEDQWIAELHLCAR